MKRRNSLHQCIVPLLALLALLGPAVLIAQDDDALLRNAALLFHSGRLAEAESAIRTVLARHPSYPNALTLLGFLQLRQNALPQAQATFEQVLRQYRDFALAQLGLGLALRQQGEPEKAAAQFHQLLNDIALGYQARLRWIDSLYLQGKMPQALEEAQALARKLPAEAQLQRLLGMIREASGDQEGALAAFLKASELAPGRLDNYFNIIDLSKARGDWSGVLRYSEAALRLDPVHPLLFHFLALARRALGQAEDAAQAEGISDQLLAAELLYTRAALARKARRTDEYEQLLVQCLQTSPRISKAWVDLGEVHRRRARLEEAKKAFIMALETDPESLPAHLGLAATLRIMGRREEAVRVYRRAMDRGIASPELYSGLAAVYLDQGRLRLASSEIRQAREQWPDSAELHSWQGRILQELQEYAPASNSFNAALQLQPDLAEAIHGKAGSDLRLGRLKEAVTSYRRATELEPAQEPGWLGLIAAYRQSGQAEQAELASQSCLRWIPRSYDCLEELARSRMAARDFPAAIRHFEELQKRQAVTRSVLDGLGYSYREAGNWDQAKALFEQSLKRFGPDPGTLGQLGYIERSRGHFDQAVKHYSQAAALAPKDAGLQHDLGFALYLQGNYAEAVGHFQASLQAHPNWGMAHYNLALNFWHLRDYAQALRHARDARALGIPQAAGIEQTLTGNLRR